MNKPFSWKILLTIAFTCYLLKYFITGIATDAIFGTVGLISLVSGIFEFIKEFKNKKNDSNLEKGSKKFKINKEQFLIFLIIILFGIIIFLIFNNTFEVNENLKSIENGINTPQNLKSAIATLPDNNYAKNSYDCSQKATEINNNETLLINNTNYRVDTTNHLNKNNSKCYVYTAVYKINKGYSRNADEFFYSKMRDGYENKVIFSCGAGTFSDIDGGCTDIGSVYDSNFTEEHQQYFTE